MANVKNTKKYKGLLAAGFTEEQALSFLSPAQDPKVAALVAAGFDVEQATRLAAGQYSTPAGVGAVLAAPVTSKDKADALVAQAGYAHTKGRVYVTGAILEAAARVIKGGEPEVVQTSGVGRTKAVVIFREDSGDAAIQNLVVPV